jgi:hypothetical protein
MYPPAYQFLIKTWICKKTPVIHYAIKNCEGIPTRQVNRKYPNIPAYLLYTILSKNLNRGGEYTKFNLDITTEYLESKYLTAEQLITLIGIPDITSIV